MNSSVENIQQLFNNLSIWSVVQAVLIIASVILVNRVVQTTLPKVADHLPPRFRLPTLNSIPILRILLAFCATLLIISILFNITASSLSYILYGLGLLLGFAAKDLISSVLAGIVAVFERPYRSGDWVRFDKQYGEVTNVGTRSLTLRTPDDNVVTIPHSRIWTDNVVNANDGDDTLMCVAEFNIDPNLATERVRDVMKDVALTSMWLDYDKPVIVVMQSQPFATVVRLKAYPFEMRDQFLFITDLLIRGRAALAEIEVPLVMAPMAIGGDGSQ